MKQVTAAIAALLCVVAASAAWAQADPKKVLRVSLRAAETGFDPQAFSDLYSGYVIRAIFEPPFRYDYRARPHKVVPNTTAALPEGSKDGREWTIRCGAVSRAPSSCRWRRPARRRPRHPIPVPCW